MALAKTTHQNYGRPHCASVQPPRTVAGKRESRVPGFPSCSGGGAPSPATGPSHHPQAGLKTKALNRPHPLSMPVAPERHQALLLPLSHRMSLETSEAGSGSSLGAMSLSGAGSFSKISQKQLLRNLPKGRVGFEDGEQHVGTPGGGREESRETGGPKYCQRHAAVQERG